MSGQRRFDRMTLGDLAEPACEGDVGVGCQLLVGKEDDEMLEPRSADRSDRLVGQLGGKVDTAYLRADARGQQRDVESLAYTCLHRYTSCPTGIVTANADSYRR